MPRRPTATGSFPVNLHEGSRSEYLGQYIFSMFGTSTPVPHQEDHGIDLYCTLAERQGQRAWPIAYYSVQIKSGVERWEFNRPESVQWVVEYPAPLLLCIINKANAQVRIYQTMARFGAAVAPALPTSMALVPGEPGSGRTFGVDTASGHYLLGPPILEFKIEDLLDDDRFAEFRNVLHFWVLNDFDNVRRYQMGMRSVRMPAEHTTNEVPASINAEYLLSYAPQEIRDKAEATAWELLQWLARVRLNDSDYLGALLAVLVLRHRDPSGQHLPGGVLPRLREVTGLDAATGTNRADYLTAPIDKLLAELDEKVQPPAHPVD
jgi:hypothetical protein